MNSAIKFDRAWRIATDLTFSHLPHYWKYQSITLLEDRHLEAVQCRIFFSNPVIAIGPMRTFTVCRDWQDAKPKNRSSLARRPTAHP